MAHRGTAATLMLLRGLDGTGRLFQSFVRELPGELVHKIHTYPHDQPLGYEELEKRIAGALPAEPFAIVAESFAGPLAIRIAATELGNCRVPLLYLRGTRDRLVSKRISEQLIRLRPDMRLVSLPAPHLVLQRQPTAAARIVSEFVSNLP